MDCLSLKRWNLWKKPTTGTKEIFTICISRCRPANQTTTPWKYWRSKSVSWEKRTRNIGKRLSGLRQIWPTAKGDGTFRLVEGIKRWILKKELKQTIIKTVWEFVVNVTGIGSDLYILVLNLSIKVSQESVHYQYHLTECSVFIKTFIATSLATFIYHNIYIYIHNTLLKAASHIWGILSLHTLPKKIVSVLCQHHSRGVVAEES